MNQARGVAYTHAILSYSVRGRWALQLEITLRMSGVDAYGSATPAAISTSGHTTSGSFPAADEGTQN